MQEIVTRKDFYDDDIAGVDFDKLDEELSSHAIEVPWIRDKTDWRCAFITIGVPPLRRPNEASRRAAAVDAHRVARTGDEDSLPAEEPIQGEPVTIPGL